MNNISYKTYEVVGGEPLITKPQEPEPITPEATAISNSMLCRYVVYRAGKKQFEIKDTYLNNTAKTFKTLKEALVECAEYNLSEVHTAIKDAMIMARQEALHESKYAYSYYEREKKEAIDKYESALEFSLELDVHESQETLTKN